MLHLNTPKSLTCKWRENAPLACAGTIAGPFSCALIAVKRGGKLSCARMENFDDKTAASRDLYEDKRDVNSTITPVLHASLVLATFPPKKIVRCNAKNRVQNRKEKTSVFRRLVQSYKNTRVPGYPGTCCRFEAAASQYACLGALVPEYPSKIPEEFLGKKFKKAF